MSLAGGGVGSCWSADRQQILGVLERQPVQSLTASPELAQVAERTVQVCSFGCVLFVADVVGDDLAVLLGEGL